LKNVICITESSTLRSPKQFCEPDKYPHLVINKDEPIDVIQHEEDGGPSEKPSISSHNPKISMFEHPFDLNVPYHKNDNSQ